MSMKASAIYLGEVVHKRLRPRRHRLSYRVFSLLLDLDELPVLDRTLRLFAHNRWGVLSFHDRDHGDGSGASLRHWIEHQLAAAGIHIGGGPIRALCYPRMLGYVFNPLTVYFCYDQDGGLAGLVYEVNNTFGQRHSYVIATAERDLAEVRQRCDKQFYVSPFVPMSSRYHFRVRPPGGSVRVVINQSDDEGPLLHAAFRGDRRTLTDRALAACFVRHPMMTLKVFAGIHWEALCLWLKGVPLVSRPQPPANPVTIVSPRSRS